MSRFGVAVAFAIAVASAAVAQTTIEFDFTPGPDGILGTGDDVPITNNPAGGGELVGDEFEPVGISFSTPGIHLNIGCGVGPGDPSNCLGADASSNNDFSGLLVGEFTLGGGPATVDLITIDVVNQSLTNLYDINGGLIGTFGPDFAYNGPTPVAHFESMLNFDAIRTLTYDGLVPEPSTAVLLAIGGLLAFRRRRTSANTKRSSNAACPPSSRSARRCWRSVTRSSTARATRRSRRIAGIGGGW